MHDRNMLLFIGNDTKSQKWAAGCKRLGHKASTANSLGDALKHIYRKKNKPSAIIIRYLNDHSSLIKTVYRLWHETLLIILTWVFRVDLLWVCHNVDKESLIYYPAINKIRRWLIGKRAKRILVTDPLLVNYAKMFLHRSFHNKINWICFGAIESYGAHKEWGSSTEPNVKSKVSAFVEKQRAEARKNGKISLIGLSLGRPARKTSHFLYTRKVMAAAKETGFHVSFIIAFNTKKIEDKRLLPETERLKAMKNVLIFEKEIGFNEFEMKRLYDFVWKSYSDYSTPISVYVAATAHKPLLVLEEGFLQHLVLKNKLGSIINPSLRNLEGSLTALQEWRSLNAERFLETRSWDIAAKQLISAVKQRKTNKHAVKQ